MHLTPGQSAIIKSTVELLKEHGLTITRKFYVSLLEENPDLRSVFSSSNQATGHQAAALADFLYAYAENIYNIDELSAFIELVCNKHASVHIEVKHYGTVGTYLLAAMKEVLGEAMTPEVTIAWASAYWQLANILIDRENQIYESMGGCSNWSTFRIQRKVQETEEITSFYLVPAKNDLKLPIWKPGQYVSVRVNVAELGYKQVRQYSLSDVAGTGFLRISVKRETGALGLESTNGAIVNQGVVSNILHDQYNEGELIEVTHPMGTSSTNHLIGLSN